MNIELDKLACLTTATHAEGDHCHFVSSAARFGWPAFFPVGWIGRRVMNPHPMIERTQNLARHVMGLREQGVYTHFLHLDSWDMLAAGPWFRFQRALAEFTKPIVFSAENGCFPRADWKDRYPEVSTGQHRFLNAGAFIAEVHAFCALIEKYDLTVPNAAIDQEVYSQMYLENPHMIELDHASSLFLNLFDVPAGDVGVDAAGAVFYPTGTRPIFLHGNSGQNGHQRYIDILK